MANSTTPKTPQKSDPLTAAMRTQGGESVEANAGKSKAAELVAEAQEGMPSGVPEGSPLLTMNRDRLLQEASKLGITLGVFMNEADLRLVLAFENVLEADKPVASTPQNAAAPPAAPPVAAPLPNKFKIRGVKESPVGKWIATNKDPVQVHLKGQAFFVRKNAIIEIRHYGPDGVQVIANCGVKLKPLMSETDDGITDPDLNAADE